MTDKKKKKVTSAVPAGVSLEEARAKLGPRRPMTPPTAQELADWAAFGSAATDQQRINVELKDRASGKVIFWNAGDVLAAAMPLEAKGVRVPDALAAAVADAARRFLAAAEPVVAWHRTRLHVTPSAPADDPHKNGAILECRQAGCGAVTEVPLAAIRAGGRMGCARCGAETPVLFARDMAAAAGDLADAASLLKGFEVRIAVRTFNPPTPETARPGEAPGPRR